jgi:cytochrome c-type biogenesis protein CcmH
MKLLAMLLALAAPATLGDPSQEARAQALEMEIRCVQCENEPIAQSTADIATDMRGLVRERIAAGDSDNQIRAFFRRRYGDFVLFRPPLDARTVILWASPAILLLLGAAALWGSRRRRTEAEPLAPEEGDR